MKQYNADLLASMLRGKQVPEALRKDIETAEWLYGGVGGAVSPAVVVALAVNYFRAPEEDAEEEPKSVEDAKYIEAGTRVRVEFRRDECNGELKERWDANGGSRAKVKIDGDEEPYRLILKEKILDLKEILSEV